MTNGCLKNRNITSIKLQMITIDDCYICLTRYERMPKILNWVEIKETKKLKHEIIVLKKKLWLLNLTQG
jgi:hypothetical protein